MPTENRLQLTVRIPESLHRDIKIWCVKHGVKIQDFVAVALEDHLKAKQEQD